MSETIKTKIWLASLESIIVTTVFLVAEIDSTFENYSKILCSPACKISNQNRNLILFTHFY